MTHHSTASILEWLRSEAAFHDMYMDGREAAEKYQAAIDLIERQRDALEAATAFLENEQKWSEEQIPELDTLIDQCRAALGRENS